MGRRRSLEIKAILIFNSNYNHNTNEKNEINQKGIG